MYHQAPCLSQSQTWALPSFSSSSLTLQWPTLSWNTCACLILTPNPPPHATRASSAPLVGQHCCFIYESLSHCHCHFLVITRKCRQAEMFKTYAPSLLMNFFRARLSFCGNAKGDDQIWNEHRPLELLPWNT